MNRYQTFSSNRWVFLFLLLMQFGLPSTYGQRVPFPIREMSTKMYGSTMISSGPKLLTIANDARAEMLASPASFSSKVKYKSNYTIVKLAIDHAATTVPAAPYVYKLVYRIEGCPSVSSCGGTYPFSAFDTLVIGYNPDSLSGFQDVQIKVYPKLYEAKLTLVDFYDMTTGTPVAMSYPLPNKNFFVELAMQYQPFLKTHYSPGDMALNVSSSYNAANQLLSVNWAPATAPFLGSVTPAHYELEWTFSDNYGKDGSPLGIDNVAYDFRHNATRIITDSLNYKIPIVYPRGFVAYRVRMIRVDSILYKNPIYGAWSVASPSGAMDSLMDLNSAFEVTTPHSGDSLNWNYTIYFAEGGKYKHVTGYFDGMLKNRQTITRFNSHPDQLLATENIYDYEGRPAITTLPAVISSSRFGYQKNVSISDVTGLPYSPVDFDVKPAQCPDEVLIPPFTNASLANRYYSRLNTDTTGMQKFVPQAEGYPFIYKQLSPGFSDRVERMGGPGPDLQVSNGHDTRSEYVSADQPDLNNLFGINAGYSNFYSKIVGTDPNGQNSLSIKDYKGNQVMTSLVGAAVDTLRRAMIYNDEVPGAKNFKEDRLATGIGNVIVGPEKRYSGSYYMDIDAASTITYEYDFKPYTVCPSPYLGLTVSGSFEYRVEDDCGVEKLNRSGVLGTTGVTTNPNPPIASSSDALSLVKGKYTINKTLTVAEADVDAAIDSFMNYKPNCLKTENEFIKEAVEQTTYPCPASDPCADLKKKMMEELFTGAKYGRYTAEGSGSITPSIYDIQNIPGLPPDLYRYQAPCVASELGALVITKYGKTYTRLDTVSLATFMMLYTGADRYTIARALLPLHPEFCKLGNCFVDTFETRFKALPDAATAAKYNFFSLDSIVAQDAWLRGQLALTPFLMGSVSDSLKLIAKGTERIDTVAAGFAFCTANEASVFEDARKFFRNNIVSLNFPSSAVKNNYFEKLRGLYLANRAHYKSMLKSGRGRSCAPCDSAVRMTLIPPPVIAIETNPDGSMATGPDSYLAMFSDSMKAKIAGYTGGTTTYADTTEIKGKLDSARALVARADSIMNSVAADSILSKMANCFGSPTDRARLRDTLLAMIARKEVQNGVFLPSQVRAALSKAGISVSDLCHPYLALYDFYTENPASGISCGPNNLYNAAREFLNSTDINTAIRNTTTTAAITTPSWPTLNIFAAKIAGGITGGSGSTRMKTIYSEADSTYHFSFFRTGSDTVSFSLLSPGNVKLGLSTVPFFTFSGGGRIVFDDVFCYFDNPNATADGYVTKYMFRAKVRREAFGSSDTTVTMGNMIGWNNAKVALNEDGTNKIANCIPCTQFRDAFKSFADSMTLYGGFAADHPLFFQSLRNYMNYTLKRVYSADQYKRFLVSCALGDSMNIPQYGGYGKITFPSGGYSNIDAFAAALDASDGLYVRAELDYTVGSAKTAFIDYRTIPFNKLKLFNERLLAAGGTIKTPHTSGLGIIVLPSAVTASTITNGTVFSLYGTIPVNVRKSPFLSATTTYTLYNVAAPGATLAQISAGWAQMEKNMRAASVQGYTYSNSFSTVNDDYYHTKKKQLLSYIYSMQSFPYSKVLDSMQANFITGNVSSFTTSSVSYADPENPNKFTDLFYADSTTRFPGYDTVKKIFSWVNTALGGKKLFLSTAINTLNITGGLPSGYQLKTYRCADDLYWYRYFGKDKQLYDIYLRMPAYIPKNWHPSYELLTIIPATGDTVSSRFTAMLKIPGSTDTIYANGSADFNIAWTSRFRDVLLGNEANYGGQEAPLSGNPGAVNNCEQDLLFSDIQEGKTNYENYIAKFRDDLKLAFKEHMMNQVKEKLWIEYADMRFGTTLYSYDLAGNLIQTVPPEGIVKIDSVTVKIVDSLRGKKIRLEKAMPHHLKTTEYEYNSVNRPWKESTPDAGTKVLFYDAKGNVLLSQGAKQRQNTLYSYFLYDGQNRLMETGEVQWGDCGYFDPLPTYKFMQGVATKTVKPSACACENLVDSVWEFCDPTLNTSFFDDAVFNAQIRAKPRTQVVYTIYDSAFVTLAAKPGMSGQTYLRGRIAANMYYNACAPGLPGMNYDHATHYSYDLMGNVQTLTQDFPQLDGMKQRYKRMDYEYDLLSGKVELIAYNRGYADQYFQRYGYDADNKITLVETSSDGFIWKRDAEYSYYQHGPLARVSIGDQRVQGVDYAYTLQGWLKSINGDRIDSLVDMGGDGKRSTITPRDAYATTIDYFPGDYKPIGYTPVSRLPASTKGLYNGNITRQTNDIANFGALVAAYTYDQMNRIRKANYANANNTALAYNGKFASAYKYDMDGNIRQLWRKDSSRNTMDSLVYEYPLKDNKLSNVLDYASFSRADVQDMKQFTGTGLSRLLYDKDGNVIKDLTNNTDSIQWNIYGKATRIANNIEKSELNFGYDALGQRTYKTRVRKTDSGSVEQSTYYVREASGNILTEYIAERELDKGGTIGVMVSLRDQLGTTNVKHLWLTALDTLGYLVDPKFSSYILSTRGASTAYTAGFYLANDPSLTQQFVMGGWGVLPAMSTYSAAKGEYPVADALRISLQGGNPQSILSGLSAAIAGNPNNQVKAHSVVQLASTIPLLYAETVQNNQLTMTGPNDSIQLANILTAQLMTNPGDLGMKMTQYYQQNPGSLDKWFDAISSDSLYLSDPWFQQSGFVNQLENTLVQFGDMAALDKANLKGTPKDEEGLYGFASWWSNGLSLVQQLSSGTQLTTISYYSDPVAFLDAIPGYGAMDTALSLVDNWDIIGTGSVLNVDVNSYSESTAPAIKRQEIRLGNHHIYGSARLGIIKYLLDQYRHSWDYTTGIIDTQAFNKKAWYSMAYNDIIDTGKLVPWGNGLNSLLTSQHVLGLKQYELTNQLGNVQATVSDKRFVKTNGNGARDYFNAGIVASYDYYPYGQLMPDRWGNDTSTVCVTTSQIQMLPRKIMTSVPLTKVTFDTSRYTGYAGPVPWPRTLTLGPDGVTTDDYRRGVMVVLDVTPGVPIDVSVELGKFYAPNHMFNTWEYHPSGVGGIRNFWTTSWWWLPGVQTHTCTPLTDKIYLSVYSNWWNYTMGDLGQFPNFTIKSINYEKVVYEPQTVLVQLCNKAEDKYEFGYNGQMKMNEVTGTGNWNSALYWEYATRSAHRANPDPVRKPWESPYAVFGSNPIYYSDVNGDDYYKGKDGKTHYEVGKLSRQEMKDHNYIKHIGEEFSGYTSEGKGIYGDRDGNITQSLSEVTVRSGKNSSVLGFGAAGDYNIMQAAKMDIGRDDEKRRMHDVLTRNFSVGLMAGAALPVIPFVLAQPAAVSSSKWIFNNLILNGGKVAKYNAVGASADLLYQASTKDVRDINIASTASNAFLGALPSAAVGYSFNISINSLQGRSDMTNSPFTQAGIISIGLGTLGNFGAGELGKVIGIPYLKAGSIRVPNDIYGIGMNVLGNSASDKAAEIINKK